MFVGNSVYNSIYDYDLVDVAQESYMAGVQNILQSLVKSGAINESQATTRVKTEVEKWDARVFFSEVLFDRVIDSTEKLQQDDFYY